MGSHEEKMVAFLRRGVMTGREATMMEKLNSRETGSVERGKLLVGKFERDGEGEKGM